MRSAFLRLLMQEDLNFLLTNRLPRRWATRFVGRIAAIEHPLVARPALAAWRFFCDVDLSDAETRRFRSLRDGFIRRLRPGARPFAGGAEVIASPCDAIVGAHGRVVDGYAYQVKGFPYRLDELLPMTDQTLPALLTDLEERGMLDTTMVVWVGEFGRTPRISLNGGRDHWPQCYSAVIAGGGAKRGSVYGASDKLGAYATVGQARPEDLAATMFEALGIDPETEITDKLKRPLPISRGKPIREVLA